MNWSVCEHCERKYLPAKPDQRWCILTCAKKWHDKRGLKMPPGLIIRRLCKSCGAVFRPYRPRNTICSVLCVMDETAPLKKLPCLRCKHWVIDKESDNGGWCKEGRWRICKPYLLGNNTPYAPREE